MRQRTIRVVAAIAGALGLAAIGLAQGGNAGSVFEDAQTISFEFAGGTAAEYAAAVRAASGEKNVVVMPGCDGYLMPPVELSGVTIEGALGALEYATAVDESHHLSLDVNQENDVFVVAPEGFSTGPQEKTEVFSLAEMIESGSVAAGDVLTAVEAVLKLSGNSEPSMRYHAETRLLMVRGLPADLDGVESVLEGVNESAHVMQTGARKAEELRREIEETRAALEAVRQNIEHANQYASKIEELAEDGGAGPLDVMEAREKVIQQQRHRAEFEGRLRLLEKRLERLTGEDKDSGRMAH